MTICILGRQPKLGLAELQAVFGTPAVQPVGDAAAQVDDDDFDLSRFGGTIKAAQRIDLTPGNDLSSLLRRARSIVAQLATDMPSGKVKLGLSFYGFDLSASKINAAALDLKKTIKKTGRSVRVIPNNEPVLSSAQVLHNQLTSPMGIELIFIRDGNQTIIARTLAEQNIDDYTLRDRGRPKRDARVGMLPPKLAQIMLNLALGDRDPASVTVLDPFCGTGVILQEAALIGATVYGSDLAQRMIDYTEANLQWLRRTYDLSFDSQLETADARAHHWPATFGAVVGETYLGQPLLAAPSPTKLQQIVDECNELHRDFLINLAGQTSAGLRLCLGVPAWRVGQGFRHLPVLDDLENLGYNRIDFVNVSSSELIYHRTDQFVSRELVVVTRK